MAAVEQHIEYKRELHAGDVITIQSAILEVKTKSIRIVHELLNDENGEVAAISVIVAVHLDTKTRKGRPLPLDIRERARMMIEADTQPILRPDAEETRNCRPASNDAMIPSHTV